MPMLETIAIFAGVVAVAGFMAIFRADVRHALLSFRFWGALLVAAAGTSTASIIAKETAGAGMGIVTRFGWPKPFYFVTAFEKSAGMVWWSPLYFIGNSLVYAAALILIYLTYRVSGGLMGPVAERTR